MEYYSAIRKNRIIPFVATWTPLEIIIWNLKYGADEAIYETEIDSQT